MAIAAAVLLLVIAWLYAAHRWFAEPEQSKTRARRDLAFTAVGYIVMVPIVIAVAVQRNLVLGGVSAILFGTAIVVGAAGRARLYLLTRRGESKKVDRER